MTLATDEFIRRFLIHVLPQGFHRIRHYGLFASGERADNIARPASLLDAPAAPPAAPRHYHLATNEPKPLSHPCPCCGGRMFIIETFHAAAAAIHPRLPTPGSGSTPHDQIGRAAV